MPRKRLSTHEYIEGIKAHKRFILSQTITLIESTLAEDQKMADEVLEGILPYTGQSLRVGISGVPGVGKSTFINVLGQHLIEQGHQLAVLSIDPSSQKSQGSILGDKTRMPELAQSPHAYIRPSSAGSTLGGVAQKTRESLLLCEAAGYDIIFIETVGVGQSETLVHQMVDCFMLLMLAGAGDELQGMKRGIMEMTDLMVIHKADGAYEKLAQQAQKEYQNALHLYPEPESKVTPKVLTCSSLEKKGIVNVWEAVLEFHKATKANGYFQKNRKQQKLQWLHDVLNQQLKQLFFQYTGMQEALKTHEKAINEGSISISRAVRLLIEKFASTKE